MIINTIPLRLVLGTTEFVWTRWYHTPSLLVALEFLPEYYIALFEEVQELAVWSLVLSCQDDKNYYPIVFIEI